MNVRRVFEMYIGNIRLFKIFEAKQAQQILKFYLGLMQIVELN